MKVFALCINPKCTNHFHEIDPVRSLELYHAGVSLITSTEGDVPDAEIALESLQDFVEGHPNKQAVAMASEKMQAIEAELNRSAPSEDATGLSKGMDYAETAPSETNDYYMSAEHREHRIEADKLERKHLEASTRKLNAEAEAIEISNYSLAKQNGFPQATHTGK